MLSLFKSCINGSQRKRKQGEVPGHGSGDASLSSSPRPPAGASNTVVMDNPNLANGSFANASYIVMNHPVMIDGENSNEGRSIKLLSEHVIQGAKFDSSDHRPGCHPETRLDISHSIRSWVRNLARKHKILWLHGPAGVGKSAILQTIAEVEAESPTSILGATLFFSRPNNRDDPQCVFITIAYRLAVIYPPYRQYVVKLLTLDPRTVEKSMQEQFKAFIVRPFVEEKLLDGLRDTVLIVLDGLDECKGDGAQREIIHLIGQFALQYPSCPLIWLIASQIHVSIDSDQGRRDVEKYLRESFANIRERYPQSIPSSLKEWPSESDFSIIATRSSGLFIFPSTLIRFIGDTSYANPDSRLKTVLEVIASASSSGGGHNPFETLDVLYTFILSEVPRDVLSTTLTLLVMYAAPSNQRDLALNCNRLGVTQGCAYGALQRLHSVLKVPEPQDAFDEGIQAFHASFYDYLVSPARSGAFCIVAPENIRRFLLRLICILLESHSIDEFVNDSVQNEFSRLAAFFQDLDFGEMSEHVGTFSVLLYSKSVFATRLEHWGVLKTVPLEYFNFNDIRFNLRRRIWRYKERGTSLQVKYGIAGQSDVVAFEKIFRYGKIANSQGEASSDYDFARPSDEPTWKADLQKNLATWTEMAPSHSVVMLGRGRKSCATFQFYVPGEL
ncbi:hypothetical protein P691DRAFT_771504 [Macrolepiota fuliginosa MF-IS2]|uniref:NACHT domain-containing protein n=1 Tax=Macrolepiota fuliginosa MF-IS2 TaxID=1400762 RepID=A0A9P5XM30_9AGAR|nr:hypothetical protein P691DRAFT_771504 [Macrolepiota fuliginosa MF-IS2]